MEYKLLPYPSGHFMRELNAHEKYFMTFYPAAVLFFSGELNHYRLLAAFESALDDFNFMFSRITYKDGKLSAGYDTATGDISLDIEYESLSLRIQSLMNEPGGCLPINIDKRITMPDGSVEGLPMFVARITKAEDGWAIGYYFNHVFLDQSSILKFFECVACAYRGEPNEENIGLVNTMAMLGAPYRYSFPDTFSFRQFGRRLNRLHADDAELQDENRIIYDSLCPCRLEFGENALSAFVNEADEFISENDVINAVLLKIQAEDPQLSGKKLSLEFPCNIRKQHNLTSKDIGNLVATVQLSDMDAEEVQGASLPELSRRIRHAVSIRQPGMFMDILNWYEQLEILNEDMGKYIPRFAVDPTLCLTTSWVGLKQSGIDFGGRSQLLGLDQPTPPPIPYIGIITERFNDTSRQVRLSISLPTAVLKRARRLAADTGLFVVKKLFN